MTKIKHRNHEELIPADIYISDIEETFVCKGLSAKEIDETQYKDITEEEAIEILEKINKENEDGTQEENPENLEIVGEEN